MERKLQKSGKTSTLANILFLGALLTLVIFLAGCVEKTTQDETTQNTLPMEEKVNQIIDEKKADAEAIPEAGETEKEETPQTREEKRQESSEQNATAKNIAITPFEKSSHENTEAKIILEGTFRPIQQSVQGKASVMKSGTTLKLKLSPFRVSNGPKLRVYLTKHANPALRADIGESYIDLGELQTFFGSQEYSIPEDIDITRYKAAVIYSAAYNTIYATAPLN